jgi:hypothetical protein
LREEGGGQRRRLGLRIGGEEPREEHEDGVDLRQGARVGKTHEWIRTMMETSRTTHRAAFLAVDPTEVS